MTTCCAVVGDEPGRHRLERAGEEQVQQQRLDEVVGVMAERDLRRADLRRRCGTARRGGAARTASTASRLASRMSSITSPMTVCSMRYSQPRSSHVLRDDVVLVVLVAGVDVDGDERERDRRALPQDVEDLQQRPAVLAARQPDHDAVAVLDQVEVDDRLGRLLGDPGFERAAVGHQLLVYKEPGLRDSGSGFDGGFFGVRVEATAERRPPRSGRRGRAPQVLP